MLHACVFWRGACQEETDACSGIENSWFGMKLPFAGYGGPGPEFGGILIWNANLCPGAGRKSRAET